MIHFHKADEKMTMHSQNLDAIASLSAAIRDIPDFPEPGIIFKDITPLLANPVLFQNAVDALIAPYVCGEVHQIVGIDARGFIFASAAAIRLKAGFAPIRKKGKLPFDTFEEQYDLEYGSDAIAIHTDAIDKGSKVLLIDDLLATGGTASAALSLLQKLEAEILEAVFLIELKSLGGRKKLNPIKVRSIIAC